MVGRHDGRPPAALRDRAAIHPVDGGGESQVAGRIAGAHPVEFVAEARPAGEGLVGSVRHHQRVDPVAPVLADPQDGRTLRPAQPLVAVAGPVRGAERVDVHGHHAGRMGAIDERVDAASLHLGDEVGDQAGSARSGS